MTTDTNLENYILLKQRNWAMWIHLASLPIFGLIFSLIFIFKFKENESPFLDEHRQAAVSFHFAMVVYFGLEYLFFIAGLIIIGIISRHNQQTFSAMFAPFISLAILLAFGIYTLFSALIIRAAVRARNGVTPLYPHLPLMKHKLDKPMQTQTWQGAKKSLQAVSIFGVTLSLLMSVPMVILTVILLAQHFGK